MFGIKKVFNRISRWCIIASKQIVELTYKVIIMKLNSSIFEKAQKNGIASLPIPERYAVAVYTAQGISDNGGFDYLLENNFIDGKKAIDTIINGYNFFGFKKEAVILKKLFNGEINRSEYNKYENIFFSNSENIYNTIDNH